MSKGEILLDYYSNLCKVLNENGYRIKGEMDGKPYELEYSVDYGFPSLTMMSITRNIDAYNFLNQQRLLKKDMCHMCGESPVDNSCTFTEPVNKITLNICRNCYQVRNPSVKSGKSGCMLLILLPIILIVTSILIFIY